MAYNLLKATHIFTDASMATSQTSVVVETRNQDNIGIQLHWTGTPTGSFSFQVSSDHIQDQFGNVEVAGNWVALPLSPAIVASGVADDAYVDINQTSAQYIRVVYTAAAGAGVLNAVVVGKGV